MRLFKRNILRSGLDDKPTLHDKTANKISSALLKVQTKTSNAMNKRIAGISGKRMTIILWVFCLFWGGLSIYFIVDGVFGSKQPAIKVDRINVPRHINRAEDEQTESRVDEETFRQIQTYKKYMDSTHQLIRPGLLDSINVLEQIYLSQQKNEANEK